MERKYLEKYAAIFRELFSSYQKQFRGKKIGVLVSGGIDSSIIAVLVNQLFPSSILISLQSEKSVDDDFVAILAKYLRKKPLLVRVTHEDLISIQPEIKTLLQQVKVDTNLMQMALASVYYWLFKAAYEQDIKTIFTGQGPDVLLGGYNKYRTLFGEVLKNAIKNDLPLLKIDQARDSAMANKWGIKIINPYLEESVIDFCLTVPSELLIYNGQEKYLSRVLGKQLKLPEKIVQRPKKAMQYSTGVAKII